MKLETVLCPIDFSPLSESELHLAAEVCKTFGARLVLHHNLAAAAPGMSKAWEWEGAHLGESLSEEEAEKRIEKLLERLPEDITAEARISRGPVALLLLYLAKELDADLIILGSHGWSSEEHASVAERMIERSPCPVLTIQEGKGEGRTFRLHSSPHGEPPRAVVATDFSDEASRALAYAFEMAKDLPLELHLVHVASASMKNFPPVDHVAAGPERLADGLQLAEERLRALVPPDLAGRTHYHVEVGRAADGIAQALQELDPEFLIMGQHATGFFRHYFTRDTSREMLHRSSCAVWYVPASQAA